MCEVDVFEQHRFCDEFSHLVKACFHANDCSVKGRIRWKRCIRRFQRPVELAHLSNSSQ